MGFAVIQTIFFANVFATLFIAVLTKTQNEPKRAETRHNEVKPAKTTQNF